MIPFPDKKYKIIYADPPWEYNNKVIGNFDREYQSGGADFHYKTMTVKQLCDLPIKDISDKDSCCFLWCVVPQIQEGLDVLKAWGFKYKTLLTWHKLKGNRTRAGMGFWFQGYTEHILFGVRGNLRAFRCQRPNVISQSNLGHSKKPTSFRNLIEIATNGMKPRIELFARTKIHGWDVWGNDDKLSLEPLEAFSQ